MASLWLNLAFTPLSSASGQAPFSKASVNEALSASFLMCLKNLIFQLFESGLSKGIFFF